ncbi:MAG: hypothetical protein ACRC5H_02695 [Treponemataceae bacterium]
MIDKVSIFIDKKTNLENNPQIQIDKKTGEDTFNGNYKNMFINQCLTRTHIIGSLPKLIQGQNVSPISVDQIRKALALIQEDLCIDLQTTTLSEIEFGISIKVDHPVHRYLRLMGKNIFSKVKQNIYTGRGHETVSYASKSKTWGFILYDKTIEVTENPKNNYVPESYQGCNVIRLEYKIGRQCIKRLFGRNLTPYDLCSKKIFKILKDEFYTHYNSINKSGRDVFFEIDEKITPAKLDKIEAEIFRQRHPDIHDELLQDALVQDRLSKHNYNLIRRKSKPNIGRTSTNRLIFELSEKVRNVMQ